VESADELRSKDYGKETEEGLAVNLVEAAYLVDRGELQVVDESGAEVGFKELAARAAQLDEFFWPKLSVYTDLRQRGWRPRLFGEGLELVVDRKTGAGEHRYLVSILFEGRRVGFDEINVLLRRALEARRRLVAAIIDKEGNIAYYTIDRVVY